MFLVQMLDWSGEDEPFSLDRSPIVYFVYFLCRLTLNIPCIILMRTLAGLCNNLSAERKL